MLFRSVPDEVWNEIGPTDTPAFALANTVIGQVRPALKSNRIGLVLSTTKGELTALENPNCSAFAQRILLPGQLAVELARANNLTGPVRCVSVACVSGLVALQLGADLIRRGEVEEVIVAGVDLLSHFVLAGFTTLKSMEPTGCRPFDKNRVGLSLGEAACAVALRLECAGLPALSPLHAQDQKSASKLAHSKTRLLAAASSNDANHLTGPSRDGSGLALAIQRALEQARVAPAQIDFVQAHGTGTPYNDRMEALALRTVFGDHVPPFNSCKGMFGHTLGAAGILETIVCLVSAQIGLLPGTPGLTERDPEIPDSVLLSPRPAAPRIMLKINSGFGGTNAAVVLRTP